MKRPLRAGFLVHDDLVSLRLNTHVPQKWLAMDMETGDIWQGQDTGGWRRPDSAILRRALKIVHRQAEMGRRGE